MTATKLKIHSEFDKTIIQHKFIQIKFTYRKNLNYASPNIIKSSQCAYHTFLDMFENDDIYLKEFFYIMALNYRRDVLAIYKVSEGSITQTCVDVRICIKFLIDVLATSVIVAHNHPSGKLEPSLNDIELTQKLKEALKLVDIKLDDHLILTGESYYSFTDEGKL